jgi:hypothetical protein
MLPQDATERPGSSRTASWLPMAHDARTGRSPVVLHPLWAPHLSGAPRFSASYGECRACGGPLYKVCRLVIWNGGRSGCPGKGRLDGYQGPCISFCNNGIYRLSASGPFARSFPPRTARLGPPSSAVGLGAGPRAVARPSPSPSPPPAISRRDGSLPGK